MLFLTVYSVMIQQQKATVLALGGIQLGLSQLELAQEKKNIKHNQQRSLTKDLRPQKNDTKDFLMTVLHS